MNSFNDLDERSEFFSSNDACRLLGSMLYRENGNKTSFIRLDDFLFDSYFPLPFPSVSELEDIKPTLFAIEEVQDSEEYPFCDTVTYKRYYLFNENGKSVATAEIMTSYYNGAKAHKETMQYLSESFDSIIADWSAFFEHRYFLKVLKDTEHIIFLESLWVDSEYRQLGIGRWLLSAAIYDCLEEDIPNKDRRVVFGTIASPGDMIENPTDFEKKNALDDLLSFYRKCFDAIELSKFCKQTQNFNYKIDLKTKHHPSVIFWSAGGKN